MSAIENNSLIDQLLALPVEERSEIASLLLKSIEDDVPPGQKRTPDHWQQEIKRRSNELNGGDAKLIDATDSIAKARANIAARNS